MLLEPGPYPSRLRPLISKAIEVFLLRVGAACGRKPAAYVSRLRLVRLDFDDAVGVDDRSAALVQGLAEPAHAFRDEVHAAFRLFRHGEADSGLVVREAETDAGGTRRQTTLNTVLDHLEGEAE